MEEYIGKYKRLVKSNSIDNQFGCICEKWNKERHQYLTRIEELCCSKIDDNLNIKKQKTRDIYRQKVIMKRSNYEERDK